MYSYSVFNEHPPHISLYASQASSRRPLQLPVTSPLKKNLQIPVNTADPGKTFAFPSVMGSSGLEPPTSRLSGARSNQLSYEPVAR